MDKCPIQYRKLRTKILKNRQISSKGFRASLIRHIKLTYLDLSSVVAKGKHLDLIQLYNILDIPLTGECWVCGKITHMRKDKILPTRHCSKSCAAKSEFTLKTKEQNYFRKYGVAHHSQLDSWKEKYKKACIASMGVDNPFKASSSLEKRKATWLLKTGYDNPAKNPDIQATREASCLEQTGGKYKTFSSIPEVKEKIRNTQIERTGYGTFWENPINIEKRRDNWLKETGFEHPMQNPSVFSNWLKLSHKTKTYVSSSGQSYRCQGYEPIILKLLDEDSRVARVTVKPNSKLLPVIRYKDSDKRNHTYYPDIGVELTSGKRIIIEVKSEYTLRREKELNELKFQAACNWCRDNYGYHFVVALVKNTKEIVWIHYVPED